MRRLALKDGVYLAGLKPEMLAAVDKCAAIFEMNNVVLTLTSTTEGTHGAYSHHYKGLAFDVRSWSINADEYTTKMQEALGPAYQVINEGTHIHVEYDPVNAAAVLEA